MSDDGYRTILDLRTGRPMTVDEKTAAREIAFGAAVETVPANVDAVSEWHQAQRDKVMARLRERYDGPVGRKPDVLHEHLQALDDFEAWCRSNGCVALPATEPVVVRYLLSRVVEGSLLQHHVSRRAFLIGKLHEETRHPPRHLGETAFNAYTRAISFAKKRLRDEVHNIHLHEGMAPAKAAEMFPDGHVPRHAHHVAA